MDDEWEDEFENEDDGLDEEEVEPVAETELTAEEAEAAEAEERLAAVGKQDELIRDLNGESDEPPVGPSTDEEAEAWAKWMEAGLAERQAERERIAAVFEREAMEAAANEDVGLQEIDVSTWSAEDFADLWDRLSGAKPLDAARGRVGDDEFERGLMRFAEVN